MRLILRYCFAELASLIRFAFKPPGTQLSILLSPELLLHRSSGWALGTSPRDVLGDSRETFRWTLPGSPGGDRFLDLVRRLNEGQMVMYLITFRATSRMLPVVSNLSSISIDVCKTNFELTA